MDGGPRDSQPVGEWGRSSAGRAPVLHTGGQEFDPPRLHQWRKSSKLLRTNIQANLRVRRLDVGSTPGRHVLPGQEMLINNSF